MLFADAKKMTEDITKIYRFTLKTEIYCDIADLTLIKNLIKKKLLRVLPQIQA